MQVEISYRIQYRANGEQREVRVTPDGYAYPASNARELGLSTVRGRDVRRVRVRPACPLAVEACEATIDCDIAGADAIFLNGYNSWTDSRERPVHDRMRGLHGVPHRIIDRWALDGSGDYRFIANDYRFGRQHGFGYGYLRYGDEVLLVGSLDEDSGFTTIREDWFHNQMTLAKECPSHTIQVGDQVELMAFALVEDKLDEAVSRWLALAGIRALPATPLVGYSSWYRHYDQIDETKLEEDLGEVHKLLEGRDLGACKGIFQVDDGYATVGDWTSPHTDRFAHGMKRLAKRITAKGLVAGLWMAPFVCSVDSALYQNHKDWLLRDEDGNYVRTGDHWNGAFALDTLNPKVREHVRTSLRTATYDWGYKMLKLDFLYGACMVPHGGMNRGQLMADALDLLRSSVAEDVVFDMCGVPLCSALGRTEYCRIGCDVGLDWDDVPWMRLLHRERVSTKRCLANTLGRAHLDGKAFRNDPDVFFLRRDVRLSHEQRSELINADAALGGMFLTSDGVGEWDQHQLLAFDHALSVFVNRSQGR